MTSLERSKALLVKTNIILHRHTEILGEGWGNCFCKMLLFKRGISKLPLRFGVFAGSSRVDLF